MNKAGYIKHFKEQIDQGMVLMVHKTKKDAKNIDRTGRVAKVTNKGGDPLHQVFHKKHVKTAIENGWKKVSLKEETQPVGVKKIEDKKQ